MSNQSPENSQRQRPWYRPHGVVWLLMALLFVSWLYNQRQPVVERSPLGFKTVSETPGRTKIPSKLGRKTSSSNRSIRIACRYYSLAIFAWFIPPRELACAGWRNC